MISGKAKKFNKILTAFMLILSLFFLFPIIWMLVNSFKTEAMITQDMNSLAAFLPPLSFENFFDNYINN